MSFCKIDSVHIEGIEIKVVRDDIFPFVGGGSKARKAVEYEKFLKREGYNAIVTCGGIQSNHNRAFALLAARNGWKCHICVQGTRERFYSEQGNSLIVRLSGAECEFVSSETTSSAMDSAMKKLTDDGYRPYYVHGGGHDLPGGTCFVDAVRNMKDSLSSFGYKPDYIYLASGTGSTQAGILVGLELVGWGDVQVIGISVAREYERGRQVIIEFANKLARHYGLFMDFSDRVKFNTDYLFGGYEKYSKEMDLYIRSVIQCTGILFDTTYSGKGLYGMMSEIKRRRQYNDKIVFWHTGGIMNILK